MSSLFRRPFDPASNIWSLHDRSNAPTLEDDVIRLFILSPGLENDPIKGYLIRAPLSKAPVYRAISWAWGDVRAREHITINGQMSSIPSNLFPALQAFRHKSAPMTLWIDSLCIDQTNLEERNHQVRLMENIYMTAAAVFAWLGPATECTADGMRWLQAQLSPELKAPVLRSDHNPSLYGTAIRGCWEILRRPWWTRMWVVQELLLARHAILYVGPDYTAWPKSSPAFFDLDRGITYLRQFEELLTPNGPKPSILQVFTLLQKFQCTDPRDRVFAILSLVNSTDAAANVADYTLTLRQVQERLVATSLQGYLQVLSSAVGAQMYPGCRGGDKQLHP